MTNLQIAILIAFLVVLIIMGWVVYRALSYLAANAKDWEEVIDDDQPHIGI